MSLFRKLRRCDRGNTLIIVAAVMPMLVGASAISIDVAQWALARRHLQRAADTGAIAGANAVFQSGNQNGQAKSAVDRSLVHNNQITLSSPALVENAPTVGTYKDDPKAVRVVVSATPELTFISFFLSGPTTISAEATAKAVSDPRYCMIALDDSNSSGMDFSGSAGLATDCGLMTNSRAKPSPYTFGGSAATASAPAVSATGNIPRASNWASATKLFPYQAKEPDPFQDAPDASSYASNCTTSVIVEGGTWNNKQLTPGCFTGLSIRRDVVLAPGVYVVKGGTLEFTANAIVTATGPVTFILTGDTPSTIAKVTMTGNSVIKLDAPTEGPLKDLLFYQDRRARHTTENSFHGNAASVFNGGIYFPGSNLTFTGNSSSTAVCARMVAARLTMTGNSSININCSGQASKNFGYQVRLVA